MTTTRGRLLTRLLHKLENEDVGYDHAANTLVLATWLREQLPGAVRLHVTEDDLVKYARAVGRDAKAVWPTESTDGAALNLLISELGEIATRAEKQIDASLDDGRLDVEAAEDGDRSHLPPPPPGGHMWTAGDDIYP